MVAENPTWGAPRIHGELLKLGFDLSERSVSRWICRAPRNPDPLKRWLTFLSNHREAIAAMDFFTVPTLTFDVLYCFFVIGHDRRKILHFNVTRNPDTLWIVQQLREAGAYKQPHRLLLPYDDCPEGRALGGCSKLILIPTLPKLDGSLVLTVTLFAPSTAGIVLTGFVTGRNGLRAFFTASNRPLKVVVNTSDP